MVILQKQNNGTWRAADRKTHEALQELKKQFADEFFFNAFMKTVVSAGGEEYSEQAEVIVIHSHILEDLLHADATYHAAEGEVLGSMQVHVSIFPKRIGMELKWTENRNSTK